MRLIQASGRLCCSPCVTSTVSTSVSPSDDLGDGDRGEAPRCQRASKLAGADKMKQKPWRQCVSVNCNSPLSLDATPSY